MDYNVVGTYYSYSNYYEEKNKSISKNAVRKYNLTLTRRTLEFWF